MDEPMEDRQTKPLSEFWGWDLGLLGGIGTSRLRFELQGGDHFHYINYINYGGAQLLNELSCRPGIGRILKSKDNSFKWNQSQVCNFIRLVAVLL